MSSCEDVWHFFGTWHYLLIYDVRKMILQLSKTDPVHIYIKSQLMVYKNPTSKGF